MSSPARTVSNDLLNWPARSLMRKANSDVRWPRFIRRLRAWCVVHAILSRYEL